MKSANKQQKGNSIFVPLMCKICDLQFKIYCSVPKQAILFYLQELSIAPKFESFVKKHQMCL